MFVRMSNLVHVQLGIGNDFSKQCEKRESSTKPRPVYGGFGYQRYTSTSTVLPWRAGNQELLERQEELLESVFHGYKRRKTQFEYRLKRLQEQASRKQPGVFRRVCCELTASRQWSSMWHSLLRPAGCFSKAVAIGPGLSASVQGC